MIIRELRKHASVRPNKLALMDEQIAITYETLYQTVVQNGNALLDRLSANGNAPVVVFIDRNVESIVAFYSVLATGNFYVPIDVAQPNQRVLLILKTLEPELLINTTAKRPDNLEAYADRYIEYKDIDGGDDDPTWLVEIDHKIIDTDPLYAMFTSGSTGVPKGVLISYRGVQDLVTQFIKEFGFKEDDIFGNQAPFDFDVSVKDLYNALAVGATIKIIPRVCFSFPAKLLAFLNEERISVAIWAVSVFRIVENLKGLEKSIPAYLRLIMFSGEAISNKTLNYWRKHVTGAEYVNLYGPTEITCNCTFYRVDRPYADHEVLPIGLPFENTRILLLNDRDERITTQDAIGEICVIGSSLGLGYYHNEKATAASFVSNPLVPHYHEAIYRTGDLGYYNEEGLLVFRSRKDHQIKHMGQRIEFGEIEANANALPMVEACCCLYDEADEKLVMFYQATKSDTPTIFKELLKRLPKYMVPNKMIHFDTLPLNNNAKIDRVRLAKEYYAAKG